MADKHPTYIEWHQVDWRKVKEALRKLNKGKPKHERITQAAFIRNATLQEVEQVLADAGKEA